VTISLSPLTAAADHSNTRTPYLTPARSTVGEYDGFEYAGLPVKPLYIAKDAAGQRV
jgi:hypothetical protein